MSLDSVFYVRVGSLTRLFFYENGFFDWAVLTILGAIVRGSAWKKEFGSQKEG